MRWDEAGRNLPHWAPVERGAAQLGDRAYRTRRKNDEL